MMVEKVTFGESLRMGARCQGNSPRDWRVGGAGLLTHVSGRRPGGGISHRWSVISSVTLRDWGL